MPLADPDRQNLLSAKSPYRQNDDPPPQTLEALLICRAGRPTHDTSRTTRHARHVTHDTITARARGSVLEFPVGNRSLTTSYQLSLMMFMQRRPRVLA